MDQPKKVYASVPNTGLIPNLPLTGVVEVATLIEGSGCHPIYFGNLPEQCAALCRSNMAVFELAVQGILNQDREAVIHAMMVDPLSAAVCSLSEIRSMAEELFAAEKDLIPQWCNKRPLPVKSPLPPLPPRTPFVRVLEVSSLLPHQSLDGMGYPDEKELSLSERNFAAIANEKHFCNMRRELDRVGKALVFFKCGFTCPETMQLNALMGYDGPVKVWLDRQELFYDPDGINPAIPDESRIAFQAREGAHELLIALDSNSGHAWGIFLRFERTDVDEAALASGRVTMPRVAGVQYDALDEVSEMAAKAK